MTEQAPVSDRRIQIATDHGIHNADILAVAAREAGVPYNVACALMQKESGGLNLWGNDAGGMFNELPADITVTKGGYEVFEYYVVHLGHTSNGVGPCQITWRGFFEDMRAKGLKPWDVHDNMVYGLGLLALYRAKGDHTWEYVGEKYNGSKSYGISFAQFVAEWKARFE